MRILIADKLPGALRTELAALGFEVDFRPDLSADELPDAIADAHMLVVRSTKVTQQALRAGEHLQMVIRAGAGTNTIACDEAARRAIYVANCPGKNAIAVAELTMGLILALDRRIPDNVAALKAGRWQKKRFASARGLHGATLGIVGLGRIGQELLTRAQAFGMRVVAYDTVLTDERADELGIERAQSIMDLLAHADVVSVHLPLNDATRHIIGAAEVAVMKPGAFLLNMARGGIVDDAAVAVAVTEGRIRAASDVYEGEPKAGEAAFSGPLQHTAGFYGTHHIGASTDQAQGAVSDEVLAILKQFLATGEVRNCVNLAPTPPASGQLFVRHLDQVGVLAGVLDVLRQGGINVQAMRNTVFEGAMAATAAISLQQAPGPALIEQVAAIGEEVLSVDWVAS